jgi:6-phosphogluconate dehydrogenase
MAKADIGLWGLAVMGQMQQTFTDWNEGLLSSYLIEITADILSKKDPETDNPLLEMILDKADQKGTGAWTSQSALELGVPTPTIPTGRPYPDCYTCPDASAVEVDKDKEYLLCKRSSRQ